MSKNRFFFVFVTLALILMVALTAREAFATVGVVSQAAAETCDSLPAHVSIHTRNMAGLPVAYTEDGPAGVDGGLIYLLSASRICSQ